MANPTKPVPVITPESEPFFAAAKRRQLVVQRCTACGSLRFPAHSTSFHCVTSPASAVAPECGGFDLPQQAGAWATGHQIGTRLAPVFRALAQDEIAAGIELLVGSKGPTFIQVGVGAGACLVLLDRIEVAAFQAQMAAQVSNSNSYKNVRCAAVNLVKVPFCSKDAGSNT